MKKNSNKSTKKKINVITGKQRRENSNSKGPAVSNMRTKSNTNPKGKFVGNTFRVTKTEYIQDVVPTSKFTPVKIEVNPSLPSSFPWLSGIAPSFQKYKIRKFKVIYEPSQSTLVQGFVMMAPEFNVTDSLPETKTELMNYSYAKRGPCYTRFEMELKVKDMMQYKDYYVRNSDVSNLVLYDPFFIVYSSLETELENSLGEIWFEYDIEFSIPQMVSQTTEEPLLYKFFVLGGTFEGKNLGSSQTVKGEVKITVDQVNQVINFGERFIGQMILVTECGFGNASDMTVNPGVLSSTSELTPIRTAACGGSGYDSDDDEKWRSYSYDLSMEKGDQLSLVDSFCSNYATTMYLDFYKSGVYEQP